MSVYDSSASERRTNARGILLVGILAVAVIALAILSFNTTAANTVTPTGNLLILAPAAFLAGVVSFLSPCTLPILPAYFAFTFQMKREQVFFTTLAFFAGLATTMVLIGAGATMITRPLLRHLDTLTLIGGILIIVFGVMSLLGKGFSGMQMLDRPAAGVIGSYVYGATFALGWTACIGPILGALLTVLASQGLAIVQGAVLAFIYALGLGLPLMLVATFFGKLGQGSRAWQVLRGKGFTVRLGGTELYLHTTGIISGVLLITMGILLATGQLTDLNRWAQASPMGAWAVELETAIQRLFFGR